MLTNNLQVLADLGNASDSDVDPLGGVHRGGGHRQGHRVQGQSATWRRSAAGQQGDSFCGGVSEV